MAEAERVGCWVGLLCRDGIKGREEGTIYCSLVVEEGS